MVTLLTIFSQISASLVKFRVNIEQYFYEQLDFIIHPQKLIMEPFQQLQRHPMVKLVKFDQILLNFGVAI